MAQLPPDLERIGDELTAATTRATRRRWLRNCAGKLAACVIAGTIVLAAASPSHLARTEGPSGPLNIVAVDEAYGGTLREPCDPPHGRDGREAQRAAGCFLEGPPPQAR